MSTPDQPSDGLFNVKIAKFAETHFLKVFAKKHGQAWEITERAIVVSLQRVDALQQTTKLNIIHEKDGLAIGKLEFKIAGRNESAKTSGNRAIVYIDNHLRSVEVLLIYSKNQIGPPNETQKWEQIIRENHQDVWRSLFAS